MVKIRFERRPSVPYANEIMHKLRSRGAFFGDVVAWVLVAPFLVVVALSADRRAKKLCGEYIQSVFCLPTFAFPIVAIVCHRRIINIWERLLAS